MGRQPHHNCLLHPILCTLMSRVWPLDSDELQCIIAWSQWNDSTNSAPCVLLRSFPVCILIQQVANSTSNPLSRNIYVLCSTPAFMFQPSYRSPDLGGTSFSSSPFATSKYQRRQLSAASSQTTDPKFSFGMLWEERTPGWAQFVLGYPFPFSSSTYPRHGT